MGGMRWLGREKDMPFGDKTEEQFDTGERKQKLFVENFNTNSPTLVVQILKEVANIDKNGKIINKEFEKNKEYKYTLSVKNDP